MNGVSTTRGPTSGRRLGRYHLADPLGGGPTGEVFRAKVYGVAGFERQFAVKRFHPELVANPDVAAAIAAAARTYGSLDHPRIARLHEYGVAGGETFTATEMVHGVDFARLGAATFGAGRPLITGAAAVLLVNAARAIGYAHGRGVCHLGVAPTNLIATAAGDVKVTDFGILPPRLGPRPADDLSLAPRIRYLAPEQLVGEPASAATDVFQLGVAAYELLTGEPAFSGPTPLDVAQHILGGAPPEPMLPRAMVKVLLRCMARSPFERYPDARALADALEAAVRAAPLPGGARDVGQLVRDALDRLAQLNESGMSGALSFSLPQPPRPASMGITATLAAIDDGPTSTDGPTRIREPDARAPSPARTLIGVGARAVTELEEEQQTRIRPFPTGSPPPVPRDPPREPPRDPYAADERGRDEDEQTLPAPQSFAPMAAASPPPARAQTPPPTPRAQQPTPRAQTPRPQAAPAPAPAVTAPPEVPVAAPAPPARVLFSTTSVRSAAPEEARAATTAHAETRPSGIFAEVVRDDLGSSPLIAVDGRLTRKQPAVSPPAALLGSDRAMAVPLGEPLEPAMSGLTFSPSGAQGSASGFPAPTTAAPASYFSLPLGLGPPSDETGELVHPGFPGGAPPDGGRGADDERGKDAGKKSHKASGKANGKGKDAAKVDAPPGKDKNPAKERSAETTSTARPGGPRIAWVVIGLVACVAIGAGAYLIYNEINGDDAIAATPNDDGGRATAAGSTAGAAPDAGAVAGTAATTNAGAAAAGSRATDAGAAPPATTPVGAGATDDPGPTDKLVVHSTPAGARVYIDGTAKGKTPLEIEPTSDRLTLVIVLAGYRMHTAQVDGHGLTEVTLTEVTPPNGPGGIKVRCKVKDRYQVFVDGADTGQLCPSERIGVELGDHVIEIYDPVTDSRRQYAADVKQTKSSVRVRID